MKFKDIPFNLNTLDEIDNNIWFPSEGDKIFMSQSAYDEAIKDYQNKKSKLFFKNVFVEYDSCEDGSRYPINIIIKDFSNDTKNEIEVDVITDTLNFQSDKINISISGLDKFTYGDFIRFCELCSIKLDSNFIL